MRIFEIEPGEKRNISKTLSPAAATFENVWERLIVPNCSEILNIYKDTGIYLYRGTKNNPPIYRGRSLENRRPADSNAYLSDLFNRMLAVNGMTVLRNNSVFLTSSRSHAANFGTIYMVFPINGFKFTYTNQTDLVLDDFHYFIDNNLYQILNDKFEAAMSLKGSDTWGSDWVTYDNRGPKQFQLKWALERLKELLPNDAEVQALTIEKLLDPAVFAKKFQPRNTNLEDAIINMYEVYLQGQYYAVEFSIYKAQIADKMIRYSR